MSRLKKLLGVPLGWAMAAERLVRGERLRPDPSTVKSVLVLEYLMPLGALVHMTPVFEAMKQDSPDLVVSVATRGLGLGVLRHNPQIDHLIETPNALTETFSTANQLRANLKVLGLKPDCVLTGVPDQRTRIAMVSFLLGTGWRGGFTLAPQLYQQVLQYEPAKSLIDNNLRLGALVGCGLSHREPKVYFSLEDVAVAESLLREANPNRRPVVVMVTQNSGGQRTGWHQDRFCEVIRHTSQVLGCCVVYVGTAADAAAVDALRIAAGEVGVSVAAKTSVTELAALLAMSDFVVSLDTGTMHVGRAVGVPMVVIGPSWQRPIEWLPLGIPNIRILRGEDRPDIPAGYQLDEVESHAVVGALTELMTAYPADAASRATRVQDSLSTVDHRF